MTDSSQAPKQSGYYGATGTKDYTYTDFTYVRRKRTLHLEHPEELGELNIVPYLDIIVNLIMFLLVVQATLVSLGLIDVTAPTYASIGAGSTQSPSDQPKKNLHLTLGIAEEGFYIAARGGVLPGEETAPGQSTAEGAPRNPPTIPLLDGKYNFVGLRQRLREIKDWIGRDHPDMQTPEIFIAADASTPYEVIVRTLDASREDATGELFPAVMFTQIR